MTGYDWTVIGAVIDTGHWVASALPVFGGVCVVLTVIAAPCIAIYAAARAIRREKQIELAAQDVPGDTAPLTVYEQAVIAAVERGELHDHCDNGSSE